MRGRTLCQELGSRGCAGGAPHSIGQLCAVWLQSNSHHRDCVHTETGADPDRLPQGRAAAARRVYFAAVSSDMTAESRILWQQMLHRQSR